MTTPADVRRARYRSTPAGDGCLRLPGLQLADYSTVMMTICRGGETQ